MERFLVLKPHKDAVSQIKRLKETLFSNYSASRPSFAAGLWSFPPLAPLRRLNAPLSAASLTKTARSLRVCLKNISADGFFRFQNIQTLHFNENSLLWGLSLKAEGPSSLSLFQETLNKNLQECLADAALSTKLNENSFQPPLTLVFGVIPAGEEPPPEVYSSFARFDAISFTAAALANMAFSPLRAGDKSFSFCWKTGKPAWLPKKV
ncbi:MAG: hypothetical protein LBC53_02645 [Spirochaetaceae bacterium]|jgi:2'-5' RNA ligase|nr:hypothetical protein [Spirochaetaceae bacterium]